jgi:hypothetical protein
MSFDGVVSGLAAIEFWAVALAVAASFLNERLAAPALGAAGFFWVVRGLKNGNWRKITRRTPVDGAVLALLGCLLVSVRISRFPQLTIPQAIRLLEGVALCYAAVNWASTFTRLRGLALAGWQLAGGRRKRLEG